MRGTDGFRKFCDESFWNEFFDNTADLPEDDTATPGSHADNLLPLRVIQLPKPLPIVSESILQMASHILEEDNSDLAVTNTNIAKNTRSARKHHLGHDHDASEN